MLFVSDHNAVPPDACLKIENVAFWSVEVCGFPLKVILPLYSNLLVSAHAVEKRKAITIPIIKTVFILLASLRDRELELL